MKLFKDILGNFKHGKHSYSQGRIYLFSSVVAYFAILIFLVIRAGACDLTIETGALEIIINALQWTIGLFAGYVLGGKSLEVLRIMMKGKNGNDDKNGNKNGNDDKNSNKNGKLLNENDPEDGPIL